MGALTAELFLAGCVPNVVDDQAAVGLKLQWVDFDTDGGVVLLFEFASQVTLDERGFT